MARDWMKTLRRASYRGAKFWVEQDSVETGRRLVVHEFPKRDTPYVEDMGRSANTIEITGYVCSDSSDREAVDLRSACERGGPANLQLPLEKLQAQCESCSREFVKDKLGYIAFKLKFWKEGAGAAPYPSPYLQRMTFVAAQAVTTPLEAAFAAVFQTTGAAGFVVDGAAEEIQAAAAALDAVREALPMDAAKSPAVARTIQQIYDDAPSLASVGQTGDRYEAAAYMAAGSGTKAAPVVARIVSSVTLLAEAALPEDAARALVDIVDYGIVATPPTGTPSRRQAIANAAAVALVLRVAAVTQYAVAITGAAYGDRRAAIQARADVAEAMDAEMERLAGPGAHGLYVALAEARGAVMTFFERLLTDLAPVLAVGANESLPSLWWSFHLYGEAGRAGEIAARNRVIHPSFMPLEFEALAR